MPDGPFHETNLIKEKKSDQPAYESDRRTGETRQEVRKGDEQLPSPKKPRESFCWSAAGDESMER
jgi:hypothetical protein